MLKFAEILTKEDLVDYFEGKKFDTIEVEIGDRENFDANKNLRIDELRASINQDIRNTDKKTILKSDAYFSNQIFEQLQYYPRRELTDIRFWQYIGLEYLQNYIWFRWSKSVKNNATINNDEKIKIIKQFNKDDEEKDIICRILNLNLT